MESYSKALAWIKRPTISRKAPVQENDLFILFEEDEPIAFTLKNEHRFDTYFGTPPSMKMLRSWNKDQEAFKYSWNVFWLECEDPDLMIHTLFLLHVNPKQVCFIGFELLLASSHPKDVKNSTHMIDLFRQWFQGEVTSDVVRSKIRITTNELEENAWNIVREAYHGKSFEGIMFEISENFSKHGLSYSEKQVFMCDLIRTQFPLQQFIQAVAEFKP